MWAKILTIKRTKDLNYFSLCAFNLFNTRVSQFELNYWNKWTFPQHSNLLRCTCVCQGSRVRHNFSRVRLTKIWGRAGATSRLRKKKVSATESLPAVQQQTHIRLISWSKPIRDSEGRNPPPPSDWPVIKIFLYVCVCKFENVCAATVRQRESWVEIRAVLPT